VEARVVSAGKNAESGIVNHGSVTNGEERRHGDSVPLKMTAIKGSGTPGAPRQLNVLSNFKYEYFVAGISGGVVSTLMLHPLDLIKIRFAGECGSLSHAPLRARARALEKMAAVTLRQHVVSSVFRADERYRAGSILGQVLFFFYLPRASEANQEEGSVGL